MGIAIIIAVRRWWRWSWGGGGGGRGGGGEMVLVNISSLAGPILIVSNESRSKIMILGHLTN